MATPQKKDRSLRPREHGAYGQLALPLAAALAMGTPSVASVAIVAAATALFLAHESLLVLAGARGAWAKRQHGNRATRIGSTWTVVGLACGMTGAVLGGEPVVRACLLPAALLIVLIPLVVRGAEKTLLGEVVAALTLAGAALPVAVAGGVGFEIASRVWATWGVAFSVSTAAVHWVLSAHKGARNVPGFALATAGSLSALILVSQSWIFAAASPMLLVSGALFARPPHARHLKRIGWSLLASGTLTATVATTLVRLGSSA